MKDLDSSNEILGFDDLAFYQGNNLHCCNRLGRGRALLISILLGLDWIGEIIHESPYPSFNKIYFIVMKIQVCDICHSVTGNDLTFQGHLF